MDWQSFESRARVLAYDVPQLERKFIQTCPQINWHGLRSPLCRPFTRLLCAPCRVDIRDTSTWVDAMMRSKREKCPAQYVGVWWLRDHIQPTSLLTLHDAVWTDARHGHKSLLSNWTKASTCYGCVSTSGACVASTLGMRMSFEISPSGKWMLFDVFGRKHFIRIFPHGASLPSRNGTVIHLSPGDMMRIDYEVWNDPTSRIKYAYIVQRVVDENGRPTPAMRSLIARAKADDPNPLLCPSRTASVNIDAEQHMLPERMSR